MARTVIPVTVPPGSYPALPLAAGAAALTFTAADVANLNASPSTGREVLLVQNTDAGAQTVTVSSVVDPNNRTGDIAAYSLPTGTFAVLGPFKTVGWKQADGNLYYQGSTVTVKFAVLQLPAIS